MSRCDGLVSGFILGVAITVVVALVLGFIPAGWFVNTPSRALTFAGQVPLAVIVIPVAAVVAHARRSRVDRA